MGIAFEVNKKGLSYFFQLRFGGIKNNVYLCSMRAVIQRVQHASVTIEGTMKSAIQQGFLILLGICEADTKEDVDWLNIHDFQQRAYVVTWRRIKAEPESLLT